MLAIFLTSANDVLEVAVGAGLVTTALGIFVAIPFFFQYFVDDRRPE